jgi:poly(A) polymerase
MDLSAHLNQHLFRVIAEVAEKKGVEAYVIGGFVRDLLLYGERSLPKDIDVVVSGGGIDLAERVRDALEGEVHFTVYRNFGTAMLKWGEVEIEFVGARKESYRRDSRKPLVENGTLEDDQNRRDFTINALAISLNRDSFGQLIDPFNGVRHLEEKLIVTPLDPARTFSDDPLRMLRGIRFACTLGFRIDPGTLEAITLNRERIGIVSQERISDELNKIMLAPVPSKGWMLLDLTGLLEILFPELQRLKGVEEMEGKFHKDNFLHTLQVLDNVSLLSENLWLRWAALLHDIAKPRTKKYEPGAGWTFHGHEFLGAKMVPVIFRKMKLPLNEKMKYVQKIVQLHLRPIVLSQETVSDSAVRRLIFDAGEDLEDLMLLCEADITSKNEKTVKRHLRNFAIVREKIVEIEAKDSLRNFQPPVTGNDIQHVFGIAPSPPVGIIKNAIKDAILDGEIPNEFWAAYGKMLQAGKSLGLNVINPLEKGMTDVQKDG